MRTYKLYASGNATTAAAAQVIVQRNGRIRAIRWAVGIDNITDNGILAAELALIPTSTIGTNDSIGSIDEVQAQGNFVTSGLMLGGINVQRSVDTPVAAGERLYLNYYVSGTLAARITCFVDIEEK
jgi:hypothetical protein